jgi:hypothetical protein
MTKFTELNKKHWAFIYFLENIFFCLLKFIIIIIIIIIGLLSKSDVMSYNSHGVHNLISLNNRGICLMKCF